jgi:hypothetical protein
MCVAVALHLLRPCWQCNNGGAARVLWIAYTSLWQLFEAAQLCKVDLWLMVHTARCMQRACRPHV